MRPPPGRLLAVYVTLAFVGGCATGGCVGFSATPFDAGKVVYDGALARIVERFGRSKTVKLHFEGERAPDGLERFGEVASRRGPEVSLDVPRGEVARVLGAILDCYTVLDMSVQDPPLDQVIARVFEEGRAQHEADLAAR